MRLNNNLLILLVNFSVYDLLADCIDRPFLNLIGLDVQESCELTVLEISFIGAQTANLHVCLLKNHLVFVKAFCLHKLVKLTQFFREILGISLGKQTKEFENILVFLYD